MAPYTKNVILSAHRQIISGGLGSVGVDWCCYFGVWGLGIFSVFFGCIIAILYYLLKVTYMQIAGERHRHVGMYTYRHFCIPSAHFLTKVQKKT